jgi:hypothetical protein
MRNMTHFYSDPDRRQAAGGTARSDRDTAGAAGPDRRLPQRSNGSSATRKRAAHSGALRAAFW